MKMLVQVDALSDQGETVTFKSRRFEVLNTADIQASLDNMAGDIEHQIESAPLKTSNISITQITKITVHYDKYNPTRGGSYIELPKWVSLKNACINIKNEDGQCFKYCVQCSVFKLHEPDISERMRHYNTFNDNLINWDCMKYPCSRNDITRFEELNSGLISIIVFKILNESIITYRITKVKNVKHHINSLIIEEQDNHHYVLIRDLTKLIGCQHNNRTEKKRVCTHCLRGCKKEETLNSHITKGCLAIEGQQIKMPPKDDNIQFKNHAIKFKATAVMYADFERLTMVYSSNMSKPIDASKYYTENYQHHKPCGYKINVLNSITNETESYLYRGSDCMNHFVKRNM